jgi:hypothetical protein
VRTASDFNLLFVLLSISFIHDHRVPQKINYLFLFLKSVLKFSTKNYSHGVHANTIPSTPPSCTGLIIQPLFTPPSPQPIILHAFINIVKYQFTHSGLPPHRDNWSLLWILTLTVSAIRNSVSFSDLIFDDGMLTCVRPIIFKIPLNFSPKILGSYVYLVLVSETPSQKYIIEISSGLKRALK